jgi:hypothetical protein
MVMQVNVDNNICGYISYQCSTVILFKWINEDNILLLVPTLVHYNAVKDIPCQTKCKKKKWQSRSKDQCTGPP